MDILWKGVVGGLLTALIVWLSKRGNVLPGILPLFPIFAIIALIVVGAKGSVEGFKEAALAGAKTIPAYLAFLAACYLAIDHMDYRMALVLALAVWVAVVLTAFLLPRWF
ncbi:MAG: GlpM family protein [Rhodospirillaceae bacterium]|nr:GlpM family protein [Rhodospirillaceae bacterium]